MLKPVLVRALRSTGIAAREMQTLTGTHTSGGCTSKQHKSANKETRRRMAAEVLAALVCFDSEYIDQAILDATQGVFVRLPPLLINFTCVYGLHHKSVLEEWMSLLSGTK